LRDVHPDPPSRRYIASRVSRSLGSTICSFCQGFAAQV